MTGSTASSRQISEPYKLLPVPGPPSSKTWGMGRCEAKLASNAILIDSTTLMLSPDATMWLMLVGPVSAMLVGVWFMAFRVLDSEIVLVSRGRDMPPSATVVTSVQLPDAGNRSAHRGGC